MDKNEFDIDFDFEKEFGLTPEDLMDPELDDDLDLSQFDLDEPEKETAGEADDLDDIESFLSGAFDEEEDFSDEDLLLDEEEDEDDGDVDLDDTRTFFAPRAEEPAAFVEDEVPVDMEADEEDDFSLNEADLFGQEEAFEDAPMDEAVPPFDDDDDEDDGDDDDDDDDDDEDDEDEKPRRTRRQSAPREPSPALLYLKAVFGKVKAAVLAFVIPPAEP